MPYLIDGHNLIGQTPGLRLSDPDDEQQLIEMLRAYLVRLGKKGTVVFDKGLPGDASHWSNSVLEVRLAPHPKTADDVIRSRLRGGDSLARADRGDGRPRAERGRAASGRARDPVV